VPLTFTANFVLGKTGNHSVADARLYGGNVSAQATAAICSDTKSGRRRGKAAQRGCFACRYNSPPSQETGEVRSLWFFFNRPTFNSHA
jgi:hypothetical protein